jgi:creatinine amidohydrolase/Fe(II)-dependent formamide hydrolase-like protein
VNLDFKDAGLYATSWFLLAREAWAKMRRGGDAAQGHAGEKETAVALAIEPENVQLGAVYDASEILPLPDKYVKPFGAETVFYHSRVGGVRDSGMHLKDPNVATKEVGEKCIAGVVDELAEIVRAAAGQDQR